MSPVLRYEWRGWEETPNFDYALNVRWFLNSKIVIFWRALAHIFVWCKMKVKRADKSKMGPGKNCETGLLFRVLCVILCDYGVKFGAPAPRPGWGRGSSFFAFYALYSIIFALNVWSTPSRSWVVFFLFCALYSDIFVSDEGSQPPVLRYVWRGWEETPNFDYALNVMWFLNSKIVIFLASVSTYICMI